MPHRDRSHIVADGRWRIFSGSGRQLAARLHVRLARRTAPLLSRANLLGRIVIRYRISRFVRRRVARLAPPEALYASRKLSPPFTQKIISEASHEATPNV
jgi:hypothetical protein